jgi:C4-dicarboxylate-specific signal transduction histidine kinase
MSRFSIGTKLIITFLALAIIPMSAIAYYNLTQGRDAVIRLAKENLIELSRSTGYLIEQSIKENQRTSATLAGDPLVVKFLAASRKDRQAMTSLVYKTLRNYLDTHPEYYSPCLLDANGIVVASLDDILIGKNRSLSDYFKSAIGGKPYASDIFVERATKRPGVFFTHPIISAEEEIVGISLIWLKADTIWKIIDDVSVGKQGVAYLVDQDGVIIAHSNRDLLYHSLGELTHDAVSAISSTIRFGTIKNAKTPVIPKSLGMDQLSEQVTMARDSGYYRFHSPLDKRHHDVGFTPLKIQPWTLVIDFPEDRFLAPLERMRAVTWGGVGLVVVITFVISIMVVRGTIRPIRHLTD